MTITPLHLTFVTRPAQVYSSCLRQVSSSIGPHKELNMQMKKNDVVKFSQLQIGDYFSDGERQKYRKVPPRELCLPGQSPITLNVFYFQSNCYASIDPESECVFIKYVAWKDWKSENLNDLEYTITEGEIEHQIEFFTRYLETLQSFLETEADNISEDCFDDESLSPQEVGEFIDLLYSSFFVSLYSFLETQLNNECRSSQQEDPTIKVSLGDLNGLGLVRAKKYLTKVLDTSFQFGNNPLWEQIQWYNKIRNCIVHNNNVITNRQLKEYITAHKSLKSVVFFGDDYLILNKQFCLDAISNSGYFLRTLYYHRRADKIN